MTKPSVVVEGVNKKFGLSLKSALKYGLIDSSRRLVGRNSDHNLRLGEFWALHDINFALQPGDALGIMGVNGSGKTTLLRILNGTYSPDTGKVTLRGRIGALIAAGAGFSPMLSGRENIYISGTLLGMTPAEITKKFDEIVAFAELGDFLDMPVRNYSSGMSIRLGFAIAVIGTPEILLVDEVLAVGDMNFQKKCFSRINQLKNSGTTILFVSHSVGAIWSICNKGIVIDKGVSTGVSNVEQACKDYEYHNNLASLSTHANKEEFDTLLPCNYGGDKGGNGDVHVTQFEIIDTTGKSVTELEFGQSFKIRMKVVAMVDLRSIIFRIQLDSQVHKALGIIDSYESHSKCVNLLKGEHIVYIGIHTPNLRPGKYIFGPSIVPRDMGMHLYFNHNMAELVVLQATGDKFFYAEPNASVHLRAEFSLDQIRLSKE